MSLSQLPYITPELPGIGGTIKVEPEHFRVEEVPLYEPSGAGDHLFVCVTRTGQTTRELVEGLAERLGIRADGIGYAGLKDRQAEVTQVLSLPYVTAEQAERAAADLGLEMHWAVPHNKKLRPGHLLGNRFTITILQPTAPNPVAAARAIIEAVRERGLPNYFGAQRFGRYGDNAEQGLAILTGRRPRPRAKWLHRLLASAYQSHLFNEYLALRIRRGSFDRILPGDLAKKTDTGGMFLVEDAESEQARFRRREITYTGPLFGYKMRQPAAAAAELEAEILGTCPVTEAQWRRHRVEGNRRSGCVFLGEVDIRPHPQGLTLSFFLPKGAYATVLLRELIKPGSAGPEQAESFDDVMSGLPE